MLSRRILKKVNNHDNDDDILKKMNSNDVIDYRNEINTNVKTNKSSIYLHLKRFLLVILYISCIDIFIYSLDSFIIHVNISIGNIDYHGGLITSLLLYRWKLYRKFIKYKKYDRTIYIPHDDLKICTVREEDSQFIRLTVDTASFQYLVSNEIIKLHWGILTPQELMKYIHDDIRQLCQKIRDKCVAYNDKVNNIIDYIDILPEDFLYVKDDTLSFFAAQQRYCQSVQAITFDSRYVPIIQYIGTTFEILQTKCNALQHCIGFSSTGWLYAKKASLNSLQIEETNIFIKTKIAIKKLKRKFPGLNGMIENLFSNDYKNWLNFHNNQTVSRSIIGTSRQIANSKQCHEKHLMTKRKLLESSSTMKNTLLVLAWTDIYLEQGNAIQFLRKMMPRNSFFYDPISGKKRKELCKVKYTVKEGDTLWDLAQKHKVKLSTLIDANKDETFVKQNLLQIGDVVCIPQRHGSNDIPPGLLVAYISDRLSVYITNNRYCLNDADALLFNAPFLSRSPPPFGIHKKHAVQPWIMMSWEGPRFSSDRALENPLIMNEHFALTATRSSRSDCPMSQTIMYDNSWERPKFEHIVKKEILYLYSNCKTASNRDEFAVKLSSPLTTTSGSRSVPETTIKLKAYGKCLKNSEWPHDISDNGRNSKRWEFAKAKLSKGFLFELVAMNSLCESYLDEKLQMALKSGSIPIVLAAPNVLEFSPSQNNNAAFIIFHYSPSIRTL